MLDFNKENPDREKLQHNIAAICRSNSVKNPCTMLYDLTVLHGKHARHRGIAVIWVAIVILMLVLFVGLTLDAAKLFLVAHQLQNASDAAALAGARIVRIHQPGTETDAREKAQYIGGLNYADGDSVILDLNTDNADPNGDIFIGRYYPSIRSFVPTLPTDSDGTPRPNAVRVAAKRTEASHGPIPLIFGPMANVYTASVSRDAIAIAEGGIGAGLIVLSEDCGEQPSLEFKGQPEVEIQDGGVQVNMPNCSSCDAIDKGGVSNQPRVYADEINLVSKCDSTNGYIFDPATGLRVTTDQTKIPDPYANMPAPVPSPATPKSGYIPPGGALVQFEPGYYPDGFSKIGTGDKVTFAPGVYVVGSGAYNGLEITGGSVCARGVMFYITEGAYVKITGGSPSTNIIITEIKSNHEELQIDCLGSNIIYSQGDSYVDPYQGMAIFQDRTNTKNAEIQGGQNVDVRGTIYFPNNHLDLGGTPTSLGIQVIADTLTLHGTGTADKLIINYDGRNRTPANSSYLVK